MPFTVNRSFQCSCRHTLNVSFPRNRNWYILLEPFEVSTVFYSVSLAKVAFSLVNLQNIFQLIALGMKTEFHQTCFMHTRRPRTTWHTCQKANEFSCATLCVACENHVYKTSQAYFHLTQSCLQASTKYMYARGTRPFSNVHLWANSGQTELG